MTDGSFDGREFLRVAHVLLALDRCEEPELRSAIGRAYYACFLRSRRFLDGQHVTISSGHNAHVDVRREIERWSGRLPGYLARLHVLRKDADYRIPFPGNLPTSVQHAMRYADIAMRILQQLERDHPAVRGR